MARIPFHPRKKYITSRMMIVNRIGRKDPIIRIRHHPHLWRPESEDLHLWQQQLHGDAGETDQTHQPIVRFPLPVMVEIPAGSFQMGCMPGIGCEPYEEPVHIVRIASFELSKYEPLRSMMPSPMRRDASG